MQNSEEAYLLTPDQWNPHDEAYAINEENIIDCWEGNMIEKWQRTQILLSDVKEDAMMVVSVTISAIESNAIDQLLEKTDAGSEEITCPC